MHCVQQIALFVRYGPSSVVCAEQVQLLPISAQLLRHTQLHFTVARAQCSLDSLSDWWLIRFVIQISSFMCVFR